MQLSTFALLMAATELLVGLPMLVAPAATADWLVRLMKTEHTYRLVGAVFFAMCVLPLAGSCEVTFDVAGIVRLAALLGAVKSLIICWWPSRHARLAETMLASPLGRRFMGVAAVAAGVLFLLAACELQG